MERQAPTHHDRENHRRRRDGPAIGDEMRPRDDLERPLILDDGDPAVRLDSVDKDLGDGPAGLGTLDVRDAPS